MGYTHYWQGSETLDKALPLIAADARKIIKSVEVPLANGLGEKGTKPLVTSTEIRLNGVEDDDYETFVIRAGDHGFQFCKTAQKPYDLIVTAILLRAQHHAGAALDLSSDGCMDPLDTTQYTEGYNSLERLAKMYEEEWAPAHRVVDALWPKVDA